MRGNCYRIPIIINSYALKNNKFGFNEAFKANIQFPDCGLGENLSMDH